MADEPTGGTDTQHGGEPHGTGTAADQGANAGNGETQEQEIARLRAAHAQGLAEKSGAEEAKRKLAEAEARLAELEARGQPSTTTQLQGPFAEIDAEIGQLQGVLQTYPNDPVTRRAMNQALQERAQREWNLKLQAAWPTIQKAPESYRDKAWLMFQSGQFGTAEAAVLAAKGAALSDDDIAAARQRKADDEAAKKAADRPATDTTSASEPAGTTRKGKAMTGAEYTKFLAEHEGRPEAHKLIAEVDSGATPVDWTR